MHQVKNSPAPHAKERRHQRFHLQFPVCLSFPSGGAVRELETVSENVSIGGLLLKASDHVPPRTRVSLTMDVKGPWSKRPVRLVARGEVVRVETLGPGGGFAIAVECQHPITEMKGHLRAAS
jgi:PilZ domain-containing protein